LNLSPRREWPVPRKKMARNKREELLVRQVSITSVHADISARVERPRAAPWEVDVSSWLNIEGTADEPIRDIREVEMSLRVEETERIEQARVPCVGVIIQFRPKVVVGVGLPRADFDRAWVMAANGTLKYARLVFTKPRYKTAFVESVSFSNYLCE
jgi:hypothetical protein